MILEEGLLCWVDFLFFGFWSHEGDDFLPLFRIGAV